MLHRNSPNGQHSPRTSISQDQGHLRPPTTPRHALPVQLQHSIHLVPTHVECVAPDPEAALRVGPLQLMPIPSLAPPSAIALRSQCTSVALQYPIPSADARGSSSSVATSDPRYRDSPSPTSGRRFPCLHSGLLILVAWPWSAAAALSSNPTASSTQRKNRQCGDHQSHE